MASPSRGGVLARMSGAARHRPSSALLSGHPGQDDREGRALSRGGRFQHQVAAHGAAQLSRHVQAQPAATVRRRFPTALEPGEQPCPIALGDARAAGDVQPDVLADTFQILLSLGHSEAEARKLIDGALAGKKKFKDVDELLKAIYERQHGAS